MKEMLHQFIEANGIRFHIAKCGTGPVVLLCHGFPEIWYSWRHQLTALAAAGFQAIAPDMRGYGETDGPRDVDQYTMLHLVGDMVGLLDALGAKTAAIAGHDWGAPVAGHCALLRPDRFRAVIGLSVPYTPRSPVWPTTVMPQDAESEFYQLYFQEPGRAEADLERDVDRTIRGTFWASSGDAEPRPRSDSAVDPISMVPRKTGFVSQLTVPSKLPAWLTEDDVAQYVEAFSRTGFRGGLNWYRNIDRNWELLAPFAGARISVPALYMAGERDLVVTFYSQQIASLTSLVPDLRRVIMLPGCGHWTQRERADTVNEAMIEFLRSVTI